MAFDFGGFGDGADFNIDDFSGNADLSGFTQPGGGESLDALIARLSSGGEPGSIETAIGSGNFPTGAPTGLYNQFLTALLGGGSGAGAGNGQNGQNGQNGLLTGRGAQAGVAGLGVGAGLIGLIQQLAGGGPVTTVKQQARTTPQEQQLTGQTLQALQRLQGMAGNAELNNAVKQLASGQLPISPDLIKQVTGAFGATAGQLASDSINNARERGFSGGTDLLAGAGSPQYSQSLAQLQSDVSNALVNLAVGLPQAASNIQSQQVGNQATGIGLQNDLLRALTQQNGFSQTSQTSGNLLNSLGPFAQVLGGTGGLISGLNSFNNNGNRQPFVFNLGTGSSGTGGSGLSG